MNSQRVLQLSDSKFIFHHRCFNIRYKVIMRLDLDKNVPGCIILRYLRQDRYIDILRRYRDKEFDNSSFMFYSYFVLTKAKIADLSFHVKILYYSFLTMDTNFQYHYMVPFQNAKIRKAGFRLSRILWTSEYQLYVNLRVKAQYDNYIDDTSCYIPS